MSALAICLLGGTLYLALSVVFGLVCGRGLALANGTRLADDADLIAGDPGLADDEIPSDIARAFS